MLWNDGQEGIYCNINLESNLKVPKREIFLTELSILSVPIWICNLRAEPKKAFV